MFLTLAKWAALACTLFFFLSPWQVSPFWASFPSVDSQSPFVSSVPQIIATVRATKKCGNANLFALVSTLGVHASPSSVCITGREHGYIAGNCSLWAVYCWLRGLYMPGFVTNLIGTALSGAPGSSS